MPNAPVSIYNTDLELVAYLENAAGIAYKKRKGEIWSASFCLPADDPKNAECQDFYYAEIYDGDTRIELFRIVFNGKSRIKGKPAIKYSCKHALCTLNDDIMVGEHNAGPGVEAALNYILGKQVVAHWQLSTVEFVQNFYHYWKDLSLLAALYTVPERFLTAHLWTFDTTSHPWTLNLLEAPTAVSARIAYRKNMQQIDRKSDVRNLYTRLYAYGYGAGASQVDISTIDLAAKGRPGFTSGSTEFTVGEVLTGASSSATAKVKSWHKVEGVWGDGDAAGVVFLYDISGTFTDGENLNGSVSGDNCATLDSSLECVYAENVVTYGVITRKWEDQRYTIVANLYAAAEEKVDANAVPELTYTVKAADLYRLTKRGQFVLGDLVKVYDEPLEIDVDARIVTLSKKDVEGKPGDINIQLGNKVEKFPDFGGIVYADDLDQVKDGTKWARVLSTQILAGEILLSAVPGSTIGAFPATPTVVGLYVGATHFGFHDGTNWITYTDNAGKAMWEGIGGDSGHIHWDPAGGGSLDIKGVVTITAGSTGVGNLGDAGDLAVLNVVGTAQITNLAVTTAKIKDLNVTEGKIANLAVTNAKIGDLAVGTGEIANLAVTEGKIANLAVTNAKIGDLAVGTGEIANLAVTEAKIADLTVTGAKIANATIGDAKITGTIAVGHTDAKCTDPDADQTSAHPQAVSWLTNAGAMALEDLVEKAKLGTTIITGGYLRTDILNTAVAYISNTAMIANAVIETGKIKDLAVTEGKIANLAVTNAKIGDLAVGTGEIANLAVTEGKIANLAVTNAKIGDLAVGTGEIANLAVTAAKIANATITNAQIASLNADKITAGTITARKYQTSSSGSRIVLNDASYVDYMVGYDSSNNVRFQIAGTGIIMAYQLQPMGGSYPTCELTSGIIGRFTYSGSTVYGPASKGTAWENLNLSSTVGARRALVLLRVYNGSGSNKNYQFRIDGTAVEQAEHAEDFPGAFSCRCDATKVYNYVWVMTGTNGYVEWRTTVAGSTTLVLLAYIS